MFRRKQKAGTSGFRSFPGRDDPGTASARSPGRETGGHMPEYATQPAGPGNQAHPIVAPGADKNTNNFVQVKLAYDQKQAGTDTQQKSALPCMPPARKWDIHCFDLMLPSAHTKWAGLKNFFTFFCGFCSAMFLNRLFFCFLDGHFT